MPSTVTPYYQPPAQAAARMSQWTLSQVHQPDGVMPRYPDEPQTGFPPNVASSHIEPTVVAAHPNPMQGITITYTDDSSTKLSDRVRRICYNCRTPDTSIWRRSSLATGKVVCAFFFRCPGPFSGPVYHHGLPEY